MKLTTSVSARRPYSFLLICTKAAASITTPIPADETSARTGGTERKRLSDNPTESRTSSAPMILIWVVAKSAAHAPPPVTIFSFVCMSLKNPAIKNIKTSRPWIIISTMFIIVEVEKLYDTR
jgi:hypothetical protein